MGMGGTASPCLSLALKRDLRATFCIVSFSMLGEIYLIRAFVAMERAQSPGQPCKRGADIAHFQLPCGQQEDIVKATLPSSPRGRGFRGCLEMEMAGYDQSRLKWA